MKASEAQKRNRVTSGQDQMNHGDLTKAASNDDISLFLDDLRVAISAKMVNRQRNHIDPSLIPKMEKSILLQGTTLREEDYGESLSDWLVSSQPSSIGNDGKNFAHKYPYDATARKRGLSVSGKTLVKEAKKCQKGLPEPTANAATFVGIAEKRMDLCRAVVTGPVEFSSLMSTFLPLTLMSLPW
jgi:hypothetical protein